MTQIYKAAIKCNFSLPKQPELENVFEKHYAPSHMPDPERQCSVLKYLNKIIQKLISRQIY